MSALPLRARLAALVSPEDVQAATVLLVSTVVLLCSDYEGSIRFWNDTLRPHVQSKAGIVAIGGYLWWFGTSLLLYLVIPCAIALFTGRPRLSTLGFGLGDRKVGLAVSGIFLAIMLPIVFIASRTAMFRGQYPMCGEALQHGRGVFIVYELAYAAYFVSWEFIFRGYLLQALKPRLGGVLAVLVQTLPFALMHSGKPEPEAYGAIVAGIALGALALRTGTFWYGAGIHAFIAVFMDLAAGASRLK